MRKEEDRMIPESIKDMLDLLEFKVVKIQCEKTSKYLLYKEHDILNYKLITHTTKKDLEEDLIHYFNNYDKNWWLEVTSLKTYGAAVRSLDQYLTEIVPRVNKLINDPAEDLIFEEDSIKYFNLFQSTELLVNKPNCDNDFPIIREVLWNLCEQNEEYYEWVINWLACLYQNPTYRFTTSIIFIGEPGSGKGMFSKAMKYIFGRCSFSANSKDLTSNFNSQLIEGILLLIANEIVDQHNRYQFSNDLKEFITEDAVSVERKFSDRYMAKNYVKTIFFSNHSNPIVIEEDDRRYFVVKSKKLDISYEKRNSFYDDQNYFANEVNGFCSYLNNYLCDFEQVVTSPPMTIAKQNIINISMTDFKGQIFDLLIDNTANWIYSVDGTWNVYNEKIFSWYKIDHQKENISSRKWVAKLRNNGFNVGKKTIDSITLSWVEVPKELHYLKEE